MNANENENSFPTEKRRFDISATAFEHIKGRSRSSNQGASEVKGAQKHIQTVMLTMDAGAFSVMRCIATNQLLACVVLIIYHLVAESHRLCDCVDLLLAQ